MIRLIDLLKEVTTRNKRSKLLQKQSSGGKALILIPGAGGKASDFATLIKTLKSDFSIYTTKFGIQFDAPELAKKIADEIESDKDIVKFAVGGYSIGGAIAWHLASKLKGLESKKFNNQLFWIDSGVPNSTADFIDGLKGTTNPPRYAIAFNLTYFKKSRAGDVMTDDEVDKNRKVFWNEAELITWKKNHKDKFLDYTGDKIFPPSNIDIVKQAKSIGEINPWIIEDKYDTTNFAKRYSNAFKVLQADVKGKSFLEGDDIVTNKFIEKDTLPKTHLGRESEDPKNPILPALSGVQIISIAAGLTKNGTKLSSNEKKNKGKIDFAASNSKNSNIEFIDDVNHQDIVKSPKLAELIRSKFSG